MSRRNRQSRSEQAVDNAISRNWRQAVQDTPTGADLTRRKCTKEKPCLRWIVNDSAPTPTDLALSITDHPLVGFFRTVYSRSVGDDGNPELRDRFVALLGSEVSLPEWAKLEAALRRFGVAYPVLYMVILESVDIGRSSRDLAAELNLSQTSVMALLHRAKELLRVTVRDEMAQAS